MHFHTRSHIGAGRHIRSVAIGTIIVASALTSGCGSGDSGAATTAATAPLTTRAATTAAAAPTTQPTTPATAAPTTAAPTTAAPATAAPTTAPEPSTAASTETVTTGPLFTIPEIADEPLTADAIDWVAENGKAEMKISPAWTPTGAAPTAEGAASLEGEWTFGVGPDGDPAVVRVSTYDVGDATLNNLGDTFWSTRDHASDGDPGIATTSRILGPNGEVISYFEASGGQYHWNGFVSIANGTLAVAEVRYLDADFDAARQVGPLLYTIQAK